MSSRFNSHETYIQAMFSGISVSVCRHHSTVVQKNEGAKVDRQPASGFIRSFRNDCRRFKVIIMSNYDKRTGGMGTFPKREYEWSSSSGLIPRVSSPTSHDEPVVWRIANHNRNRFCINSLSSSICTVRQHRHSGRTRTKLLACADLKCCVAIALVS